jgi:hypothetical protein
MLKLFKNFKLTEHWPLVLVFLSTVAFLLALANENKKIQSIESRHLQNQIISFVELKPLDKNLLGMATNSSFKLTGVNQLDEEVIQRDLIFDPPISYSLNFRGSYWEVSPLSNFKDNELVKISLKTNVNHTERLWHWAYQAKEPFDVVNTNPENRSTGVGLMNPIIIRFSHDIFYSGDQYLSISPKVAGNFKHVGRNLILTPTKPLQSNTIYQVRISKNLPLKNSKERLANDYLFSFQTSPTTIDIKNYTQTDHKTEYVFTPQQPPNSYFPNQKKSTNSTIKLYLFPSEDLYIDSLKLTEAPWWSTFKDRAYYQPTQLKSILSFNVRPDSNNTITFPFKLSPGYYLADFNQNKKSVKQIWLQITNLSAFSSVGDTKLLFWINNERDQPVEANISLYKGGSLGQSTTSGLVLINTPTIIKDTAKLAEKRQQLYYKITNHNNTLILPVFDFSSAYFQANFLENVDSKANNITISKFNYKPGENIELHASGQLSSNLSIELSSPYYRDFLYKPLVIRKSPFNGTTTPLSALISTRNLLPGLYTLKSFKQEALVNTKMITLENCSNITLLNNHDKVSALNVKYKENKTITNTLDNIVINHSSQYLSLSPTSQPTLFNNTKKLKMLQIVNSNSTFNGIIYTNKQYQVLNNVHSNINNNTEADYPVWSQTASNLSVQDMISYNSLNQDNNLPSFASFCQDYNVNKINKLSTTSKITIYQLTDGGISLNLNSPSNLELSVLVALTNREAIDQSALINYLVNKHDDINGNQLQSALSLAGLAFLNQPVLNRITSWLDFHRPTAKEKVYLAIAINHLGATSWSEQIINGLGRDERNSSIVKKLLIYIN